MDKILKSLERLRNRDWDYSSGRVFCSMGSKPLKKAMEAHSMFLETNSLDPKIFPSVKILEEEVIGKIGELFSEPKAGGYITSGGTEGNIVALWLARKLLKRKTVVAPGSVHYSVDKACDLQQLKLIHTKLDDEYRADVESVQEKVNRETLAIVATAGTTTLGLVDPIEEIAEVAGDSGCFLHVDASFGGFVLPFIENSTRWDFRVKGVSSITADPHKMGLVPIPAGSLLFRDKSWLKALEFKAPYLSEPSPTLLGTRPGASVAAIWAAMNSLGSEGYERIIERCMNLTRRLANGIRKIEGLNLVVEPELNMVAFKSRVVGAREIYKALEARRWQTSLISKPQCIRLIVMPHHRRNHVDSFLTDLAECMEESV